MLNVGFPEFTDCGRSIWLGLRKVKDISHGGHHGNRDAVLLGHYQTHVSNAEFGEKNTQRTSRIGLGHTEEYIGMAIVHGEMQCRVDW